MEDYDEHISATSIRLYDMTELRETAFTDYILDGNCSTADPIINIS
jgi:hypothetical protein